MILENPSWKNALIILPGKLMWCGVMGFNKTSQRISRIDDIAINNQSFRFLN